MRYLTVNETILIHDEILKETGGLGSILNYSALESATERPKTGFGDQELFPTLFDKAAAIAHAITKSHPFVDGNKRTAYIAADRFLELNGYLLQETEDAEQTVLALTDCQLDVTDFSKWLQNNSVMP